MNLYRDRNSILESESSFSSSSSLFSDSSDSDFRLSSSTETDDKNDVSRPNLQTSVWNSVCASTSTVFEGQQGPSDLVVVDDITSPLDYFQLFFNDSLMAVLVEQTNLYAAQYIEQNELESQSRVHKWVPTSKEELKVFLGLFMVTSLMEKKGSIDYFWTKDAMLFTPFFSNTMSRNRFQLLSRFFHFADNSKRPSDCQDGLYKIRVVYDHLLKKIPRPLHAGRAYLHRRRHAKVERKTCLQGL